MTGTAVWRGPREYPRGDMPWRRLGRQLSRLTGGLSQRLPLPGPPIPDPGIPVQLAHLDDVAASQALRRIPGLPAMAEWVHAGQAPSVMDTGKAKRELGWRPAHTSQEALADMAAALRERAR